MLANVTYAVADDCIPISQAYQPPTNKHASRHARDQLRTDQLRDCDALHATRHATGAQVLTDLEDDDNGDLDRQERRVRARLNPEPAESDDSSESVDGVLDRHAQAYNQDDAFIDDGGADSEAEELDEEDEGPESTGFDERSHTPT